MIKDDQQSWPLIAGITVLGLFLFMVFLGPTEQEQKQNPGANPAPGLSFQEDPKPLPDKFRPLGQATPVIPEAEPDNARPELDLKLPPEVAKHDFRKVFSPPQKVTKYPESFRGTPYICYFGGPGKQPGEFAYPRALAATDSGKLFIVDKSGRIQRFNNSGELEIVIRTPKIDRGKPTGLGLTKDNHLLVADTHYARILRYDLDLNLVSEFGDAGLEAGHFLFVTDCEECWNGEIFVSDYGDDTARVQVFTPEGKFLRTFGTFGVKPGQFQRPMALTFDYEAKELFVADAVNHRIQVFDVQGKFKRSLGEYGNEAGNLKYPYDIKLDSKVGIWVAEFGNNRIQVLHRQTGRSLGLFGKPGRKIGFMAYPWGVAILPEDRIAILDSGNDRVYISRRSSILETGS